MALSNAQSWISRVDSSTKDTISGYVRNVQQMLPSNNSYFNIPFSIQYMILKYYWLKEYFVQVDHEDIEVNSKENVVTRRYDTEKDDYCTVYGAMKVEVDKDYIYEWHVKILKLERAGTFHHDYRLGLGLCSNNKIEGCFLDSTEKETKGFLLWECGQLEKLDDGQCSCVSFNAGDVVKIVVNTKYQECNVYVNDTDKGDIGIDWLCDYYFAVCFGTKNIDKKEGISVKLIHFDCKQT